MSILNVEHLTHGFGDRAIFHDVSFRLLKGEHIGLVGANGEGKSTFFNKVVGKRIEVAFACKNIQRNIHLYAVLVRVIYGSCDFVVVEVVGKRTQTEFFTCKVDCVCAEVHCRFQFFHTAGRCQQFRLNTHITFFFILL